MWINSFSQRISEIYGNWKWKLEMEIGNGNWKWKLEMEIGNVVVKLDILKLEMGRRTPNSCAPIAHSISPHGLLTRSPFGAVGLIVKETAFCELI